jgi:hypothetical protein
VVNSLVSASLRIALAAALLTYGALPALGADDVNADLIRKINVDIQARQGCSDAQKDERDADVIRLCTPIYLDELKARAIAKNRLPYDRKMHNTDGVLSDLDSIASAGLFACENIAHVAGSEMILGYRTQARRDLAFGYDLIRQTKRSDMIEEDGSQLGLRYDRVRAFLVTAVKM